MIKKIIFFIGCIFFFTLNFPYLIADEKRIIPVKKPILSEKEIKQKISVNLLKPLPKPLYNVSFESLERITHMAFSQKRKMLKTSLKEINGEKILKDLNICPNLRPENLSVIDFCKIAEKSFYYKH